MGFSEERKKPIECFLSSVLEHLPRINIIRTSQSINKENVNDPRKKAGLIGTSTHSEANQSSEALLDANEVKINETRRVTCAFFEGPSLTGCNLNPELTRAKSTLVDVETFHGKERRVNLNEISMGRGLTVSILYVVAIEGQSTSNEK